MGEDSGSGWTAVVILVPVALVLLVLLVSVRVVQGLRRAQARVEVALVAAREESEVLRRRVARLEARTPSPADADPAHAAPEHVITMLGSVSSPLGEHADADLVPTEATTSVPAPLFADLVLREGVVQAASLAAGVRRALAPEHRHRIRLAMRREVKRSRKQRRLEVRQARRDLHQRQRTGIDLDGSAA